MFNKSDKTLEETVTQPQRQPSPTMSGSPSIISADLKITGDVESDGDMQIDGVIEGDVKSQTLTVGQGARVRGSIFADKATIAGTISGQIKAKNVTIAKTARVEGDVIHDSLEIEAGAFLEGRFTRLDAAGAKPRSGVTNLSKPAASSGSGSGANGKELAAKPAS